MSDRIHQMALSVADVVSNAVDRANYSRPHICNVAHRAAYLASYHQLAVLESQLTGTSIKMSIDEVAKQYDEKRRAEHGKNIRETFEAVNAARKRASSPH